MRPRSRGQHGVGLASEDKAGPPPTPPGPARPHFSNGARHVGTRCSRREFKGLAQPPSCSGNAGQRKKTQRTQRQRRCGARPPTAGGGEKRRNGEAGGRAEAATRLRPRVSPGPLPHGTGRREGGRGNAPADVDLALRGAALPQVPLQAAGSSESPRPVPGGTVTV